jgi:hypothetical protein
VSRRRAGAAVSGEPRPRRKDLRSGRPGATRDSDSRRDCYPVNDDLTSIPAIRLFPQLAHAALKRNEHGLFATWAVLRANAAGSGRLDWDRAVATVVSGRAVSRHRALEILRQGDPQYWRGANGSVWIVSAKALAAAFDVGRVGTERLVDPEVLRGSPATLRAAFYSMVYATDENGSPLTRRKTREITGVPESTQRRYDGWGHVERVSEVHVALTHIGSDLASGIADAYPGWGFYKGRFGTPMRRHGDIRKAVGQTLARRSSARRVNSELARGGRPVLWARGERPLRSQFRIRTQRTSSATAWLREKRALGKRATQSRAFAPVLAYSALEQKTRRGRRYWTSAVDPPLNGGHRLSGS